MQKEFFLYLCSKTLKFHVPNWEHQPIRSTIYQNFNFCKQNQLSIFDINASYQQLINHFFPY